VSEIPAPTEKINNIKRPSNPWTFYLSKRLHELTLERKGLSMEERRQIIMREWSENTSEEFRRPYYLKAQNDKDRYHAEVARQHSTAFNISHLTDFDVYCLIRLSELKPQQYPDSTHTNNIQRDSLSQQLRTQLEIEWKMLKPLQQAEFLIELSRLRQMEDHGHLSIADLKA
jgi:hypothetical protein